MPRHRNSHLEVRGREPTIPADGSQLRADCVLPAAKDSFPQLRAASALAHRPRLGNDGIG